MDHRISDPPFFQHPELDGGSFFFPAGPVGVLLLHGFTATTVEVRPLAAFLHQNGLTVSAPLLPGHGATPDDLNNQRWQDWLSAAGQAYRTLCEQCGRVFVGGESMGALLALHLAAQHPVIEGLLIYAPAIRIPRIWISLLAAPFISTRRKTYTSGKDPACFPWQGYTVIPVRALVQLYRLQRHARACLPDVKQPVRIFQGRQDRTIDPRGAQMIYERIGSSSKGLQWFSDSGHCVLLDSDFERIASLSLGFIHQVIEGI